MAAAYPKAQPPLEWSATKNVVWSTPMPGYGVSHPVLLGQRIFICAEPATLLCLNRDDGKILWQKTNSYAELEVAPDVRERIKEEQAKIAVIAGKESAVRKERKLSNALSSRTRRRGGDREEAPAVPQAARRTQKGEREADLGVLYSQPGTHPTAGYTAATPVTNGKEVFVAFGNGLVACFDLDGNRKWLKLIEHSNAAFAHSGSPVLAGGKLLIHFTDLVALDPKTGTESCASSIRRATARHW